MKLGDVVVWTSQAGGHSKTKEGTIVAVVPPNGDPRDYIPDGLKLDGPGYPRNTESYLIRVRNLTKLYWPFVGNLRPAGPTPEQAVVAAAKLYRDECYAPVRDLTMVDNRRRQLFDALLAHERAEQGHVRR